MAKYKINLGAGASDIVEARSRKNAKNNWEEENPQFSIPMKYISKKRK